VPLAQLVHWESPPDVQVTAEVQLVTPVHAAQTRSVVAVQSVT